MASSALFHCTWRILQFYICGINFEFMDNKTKTNVHSHNKGIFLIHVINNESIYWLMYNVWKVQLFTAILNYYRSVEEFLKYIINSCQHICYIFDSIMQVLLAFQSCFFLPVLKSGHKSSSPSTAYNVYQVHTRTVGL